jgi:DUF4097 and DUF4098 domain-containing protein YvlB
MRIVHKLLPATLALLASTLACGGETPANFEREVAADAKGVVEVTSTAGTIDVSAWDRAAVSVKAELGEAVDHVEVSSSGNHTVVRVILRSHEGGGWNRDETHLRVKIPKDSELHASGVSANVTSSGVLGIQRLKSVSGDVTAEIGPSDVEVKSVSGSLKLRGHGQPARLYVSTVSGDVEIAHAAGELETTSVSGEITAQLDSARSVRARGTSGDIHLEAHFGRGADLDAQTVSGDVKLRGTFEDGFEYEAQSVTGDISDCFNVRAERTSQYGPGQKLRGTRGAGNAHVRVKSMSGEIELCDH